MSTKTKSKANMTKINITWSYSSLKTFEQCPKKYYHLKVAQDVKDKGSAATIYGSSMHSAAENYVKDGTPVPPQFRYVVPVLDALKRIEGDKYCELKLGLRKTEEGEYKPCGFSDPDYWWHGIADLVIINGPVAYSVDYKTSKNAKYADTKQLDIAAAALFIHFPQLEKIKSSLLFVVSKEFIRKDHYVEHLNSYLESFTPLLDRLEAAFVSDVWNVNTGPLCGYCPVTQCEFNRRY